MHINGTSKLIVEKLKGGYRTKNDKMTQYRDLALDVISQFSSFMIQILPRKDNRWANTMASIASLVSFENNIDNFQFTI